MNREYVIYKHITINENGTLNAISGNEQIAKFDNYEMAKVKYDSLGAKEFTVAWGEFEPNRQYTCVSLYENLLDANGGLIDVVCFHQKMIIGEVE